MNPPRAEMRVRHLSDDDWDEVVDLEFRTYEPAGLSEGRAALQARASASPSTCFVLRLDRRLAGYALALPYPESAYPELAGTAATAFESGNLHLHDLVIEESLRRLGLGRYLLHQVTATAAAHGYERISLVAVGGSDSFWARHGFLANDALVPSPGYGAGAVYMSAPVPAGRGGTPAAAGAARTGSRDPVPGRGGDAPKRIPGTVLRTNGAPPRGSSTHRQKG